MNRNPKMNFKQASGNISQILNPKKPKVKPHKKAEKDIMKMLEELK